MSELMKIIKNAEKEKVAVGHFNFGEIAVLRSIANVAKGMGVAVIAGTSEGERKFFGPRQAVALVKSLRQDGLPIFINADHTKSFDKIKEAVAAGYDAVLFDGTSLSLEENIKETRKVVEYVKSKNPDIIVEGELGYIGSASKLLEKIPEGAAVTEEQLTKAKEAEDFVKETGVDMLAPAVGNIHGMLIREPEPSLNLSRIRAIKKAVKIPLVLHGASGNSDEDLAGAIKAGIAIIHISTEIRVAWRKALENALQADEHEVAPYNILKVPQMAAEEVISKKLKLFNKL